MQGILLPFVRSEQPIMSPHQLYLERQSGQFWAFVVKGSDNEAAFADRSALAVAQETRLSCRGPFQPSNDSETNMPQRRTTVCSTEELGDSGNVTLLEGSLGGFGSEGGASRRDSLLPLISAGPMVKVFASLTDLREHVAKMEKEDPLDIRPHIHVQYPPPPNRNWAHHVMENMYAAWMATSKFGLENETICFVLAPGASHAAGNGTPRSIPSPEMDPMSTFGACPSTTWEELTGRTREIGTGKWMRFDHWIFRISAFGILHRTHHYEASFFQHEEDASMHFPALFRHRMYNRYELEAPTLRSFSNESRPRQRESSKSDEILLNALIIPNKWSWGNLTAMASMINEELTRIEIGTHLVSVGAKVLDWKTHNTMTKQLSIIRETE